MIHTPLIQYAIDKVKATSYLEIGINNPAKNFDLIKCKFKIGVDPNPLSRASFTGTSDEFFRVNDNYFDVIFIDGLHHSMQVNTDFFNSTMCLSEGGIIIIHDTDPQEERFSAYPRKERGRWNGDVYKFITRLPVYDGWSWMTPDNDPNGLTFVKRSDRVGEEAKYLNCDWQTFRKNRKEILNLCTWEQLKQWL
jgi:hypothetical protein